MKELYKGPRFYEESDKDIFYGRDRETKELYYLVENSDFCVCYAESGEGKSSLINAGLFPMLRANDFLPVRIVLSDEKFNADLRKEDFDNLVREAVEMSVEEENKTKQCRYISYSASILDKSTSGKPGWEIRNVELRRDSFHKITPVIVFDQFEEVFSKAKTISWTNSFFSWLEDLYDGDAHNLHSTNQQKHFKVLLSMRSDYISELDYWSMTKFFIPSLKNNRYCLRPLTIKSANDIVEKLTLEIPHSLSRERIIEYSKIEKAKNATDQNLPCVSAFVLSLLLTTLNEKVQNSAKVELCQEKEDFFFGLINQFYERSLKQCYITAEERDLLEDLLVDDSGIRKRMPKISFSFLSEDKIMRLAHYRVINIINENIELAHDKLTCVVTEHRRERRLLLEREKERLKIIADNQKRQKHNLLIGLGVTLSLALSYLSLRFAVYDKIDPLKPATWLYCFIPAVIAVVPTVIINLWYYKRWKLEHLKNIIPFTIGLLWVYSCLVFNDILHCPIPNCSSEYADSAIMIIIVPLLFFLIDIKKRWWYNMGYITLLTPLMGIGFGFWNLPFTCILIVLGISGWLVFASVWSRKTFFINKVLWCVANVLVVFATFFLHMGFSPIAINYDDVPFNTRFNEVRNGVVIVKSNGKYGVLSSWSGEEVIPCIFDIYPDFRNDSAFGIVGIKAKYEKTESELQQELILNSWIGIKDDTLYYKTTPALLAELYEKSKEESRINTNKDNQFVYSDTSQVRTAQDSLNDIRSGLNIMKAKTYFEVVHNVLYNLHGDSFQKESWDNLENLLRFQTATTEYICKKISKSDTDVSTEDFKLAVIPNFYLCILKDQINSSFTNTMATISLFQVSLINEIAEKNNFHLTVGLTTRGTFDLCNDSVQYAVTSKKLSKRNPDALNNLFYSLQAIDFSFNLTRLKSCQNTALVNSCLILIYNIWGEKVKAYSITNATTSAIDTILQKKAMEKYYEAFMQNMIRYVYPIIKQRNADNWYTFYNYNIKLLESSLLRGYDIEYGDTLRNVGFKRDEELFNKLDSINNNFSEQGNMLRKINTKFQEKEK